MANYPPADTQTFSYGGPYTQEEGAPPMMPAGGQQKRLFNPRNVFIGTGIVLLTMLCTVPIWNALALLSDFNYLFWAGSDIPTWMVSCCLVIIVLYTVTVTLFFSAARPQVQTEQTIMMIANIFITLLGLVLMLISLPLSRQAISTYNNLMYRCDYSEQTHRLYEYSQVLHNIRRTPLCAEKYTVEECPGYEEAKPYTTFLKEMEGTFRCSGFCYRPSGNAALIESKLEPESDRYLANKGHRQDRITPLNLGYAPQAGQVVTLAKAMGGALAKESHRAGQVPPSTVGRVTEATITYPPTLFSDANYQASCEGMAARDMKNFSGDVGFQTFYQGIYLVLIAIATGFLKLVGFCVRREPEYKARGY
mmetsp:Transcript_54588/g.108635  ORF Transcript_54588/g.108635 Transcript_54588/m.108635 type:complete len:364 (+) Transcript_54588:66-1157(+)